jgi:hypothetical protein
MVEASTPKRVKHHWVHRFEVLSSESGENYLMCKRCGVVQNEINKDRDCKGLAKIGLR